MHLTFFHINRISELASERIVGGKNSRFGFKTDACSKTIGRIVTIPGEGNALIFIVRSIAKKVEIGIFFYQVAVFKGKNIILSGKNGFFVKSAQSF